MSTHSPRWQSLAFVAAALAVAIVSGADFRAMHEPEPFVAGPGVAEVKSLGDYAPEFKGSDLDTPVYILAGALPGATALLIGGTHPQEVSGVLAAVVALEKARMVRGRLIVIPQANRSGFTYTEPLEGFPHRFEIATPNGPRWFRVGMRLTNPVHQWPDPELYVHFPSGERMVGWEARNLNRNYPGDPMGRTTARIAAAIVRVIAAEKVDLVLDMHEAYPEYPIINMMVAHERAFEVATIAAVMMKSQGVNIDVMPSPKRLHGLSHRELGDATPALSILSETANPAMGRFRGRTDEHLVVEGRDENYVRAARLKRLFVPFDEKGHPLNVRVARQLATATELVAAFNDGHPQRQILIDDLPDYGRVVRDGLGPFLNPPPRGR